VITLSCIRPRGFNVGNDAIHLCLRATVDDAAGRIVNMTPVPATSR
jgi:hypothetical protein